MILSTLKPRKRIKVIKELYKSKKERVNYGKESLSALSEHD